MTEHPPRQLFWRLYTLIIAMIALAVGVGAGLLIGVRQHPSAATPVGGAVDIGFAQDMSAHHQQALMMCDLIPVNVAPDVRGLASEIRLTQWREIGQMTGWLQMLDAPLDNPHPMAWMTSASGPSTEAHHHDDGAMPMPMPGMAAGMLEMPGMANGKELTALSSSAGKQAETLFLQLMIRHHQGGVDMAAYAAREAHDSTVKEAALGMVKDQTEEIQLMMVMLDQRGGQVLPYPNR